MILGTTYINVNIERIGPKKGTLRSIGSSHDATEASVCSAAYTANSLESRHGHPEKEFSMSLCTALCQTIILPMGEVHLHVRSNVRGVRMVKLQENLVKHHQAFVVQGIAEIVPTPTFTIEIAASSGQQLLLPKRLKVSTCVETHTCWCIHKAQPHRRRAQHPKTV